MPQPKHLPTFDEYVAAQLEWADYSKRVFARGADYSVSVNNRLAKRAMAMLESLRTRPEWPDTLESMAVHENPHVRMMAAHDIFDANPERALGIWAEIEHGPYGMSFEAHWAARGRVSRASLPKPTPAVRKELPSHPSSFDPERERIAEAVLAVHGAIMNGGFLTAFAVAGGSIADAIRGYEQIGLERVAALLRAGSSLFPGGVIPGDPIERQRLVDEVIDAAALEALDGPYDSVVPSDEFLGDRLDAFLDA